MPEYQVAGVAVNFPYEPYDVQMAYMEKVIACLRDGTNGMLESPTGTGKTLSLLCSSLAWLLTRKADMQAQLQKQQAAGGQQNVKSENPLGLPGAATQRSNWAVPKIIYASRTHSQLTQAMQELKRTAYSFMRAVVLGSRDQLCIHPDVMREQGNANKITMCKLRVQSKSCTFQSRVEQRKDHPDFRGPTVMDIEDLVKVGQKLRMCPYYSAKELVADADITFMPYNYLLDPKARKANKVELNNTIVILDEAHNIEKICEESASVQVRSSDVAMAIEDVTHIMKAMTGDTLDLGGGDEQKDFTIDDLALLKEMLLDLEKTFDEIVVEKKAEGATYPASFLFELLAKANFNPRSAGTVVSLLEKLVTFLAVASQNTSLRKGRSFEVISDLLSLVFMNKEENMPKVYRSFKVHVEIEEPKKAKNESNTTAKDGWLSKSSAASSVSTKTGKIVNYWCFNPGFGMEQLLNKNIRSIILTSGTLAPMKPLIAELAVPVAHFLENPHIVKSSQVLVKIIGTGPDREQLISNYANRDNPKYISSLGQTILNVARIVPDGLLVFFPSYPMLNQCVNAWQASGLWSDLSRHKPVYVEPRNKDDFIATMEQFYQSINDSRGACFMAVCRGKVSEGLDFADRNGRAVIITGLPFPPLKDPKVILKRRYLEENRTRANELLSGQEWYGLEATRAVNQAIGRVIRHRNDYGAILLCDMRFQQSSQVNQLSKWVRGHLGTGQRNTVFGPVVRELREFFKNAEKTVPKPQVRSVDTLVSETCAEAGIVAKTAFGQAPSSSQVGIKREFQPARYNAIKVENSNTIASWTPEDYKAASTGRGGDGAFKAVDFMSRLNSETPPIDFNIAHLKKEPGGDDGLVAIHKRERTSPASNGTPLGESGKRPKRYRLVGNDSIVGQPLPTSPSAAALDFYSLPPKPRISMGSCPSSVPEKQAPEDRVEFLRILRGTLTKANFSLFTAALVEYKREANFGELMKILLQLMDEPAMHYLLLGMRRFMRTEHKSQFDNEVACIVDR